MKMSYKTFFFVKLFFNRLHQRKSPLYISEIRSLNLKFPKFDFLIHRIQLFNFSNLSHSFKKFINKKTFLSNSHWTFSNKTKSFLIPL